MKPALIILTLLLLAACRTPDSVKKSKAEQDWFDSYYGISDDDEEDGDEKICEFYGTCPKEEKEDEAMCKFYGTCPK